MRNVYRKILRERRRGFLWWSVGILAYQLVNVAAFPFVAEQAEEFEQLLENYPDALLAVFGIDRSISIASPAGYLDSQSYAWLIPLLFIIYLAGIGARAIAGEEEAGTLELLLSAPVSRDRVVRDSAAAMVTLGAALGLVLAVGMMLMAPPFDLDLPPLHYLAASVAALGIGLVHGGLALLVGAWTGRRGYAIAATGAVGAAGFLLNSLSNLVEALEPYRWLSPFFYYGEHRPLANGFDGRNELVLFAIAALFLAVSAIPFRRRDIGVA